MTPRAELPVRAARVRMELADLDIEAKIINQRRDALAKELDDLVTELNVEQIAKDYPAFERELLKISFV